MNLKDPWVSLEQKVSGVSLLIKLYTYNRIHLVGHTGKKHSSFNVGQMVVWMESSPQILVCRWFQQWVDGLMTIFGAPISQQAAEKGVDEFGKKVFPVT